MGARPGKLKILHVLHAFQVGGLENGVVNLINSLDATRFDHVICCIANSGPMAERLQRPVPIFALGKGSARDLLLSLKIARLIRQVRPDIVHTRNWGAVDGIIAARLAGVRCVIHSEHGREAADPAGANGRRNLARRLLSPLVSRFVTVSDDLRSWLVHAVGVPGGKVLRIMNGVDTQKFVRAADPAAAKLRLGLDPQSFVVGTVGRLDPVKDQKTLIEGFGQMLRRRAGSSDLVLAGCGPEEGELRALVANLGLTGRVHLLGERRDIPELLAALDVFVLPSLAEGISNTLLEAMASGIALVATRVGGSVELVREGENGFLFEVGDRGRLAEILALEPDLLQECGRRGRRMAEQEFSLAQMVANYDKLYQETSCQH